MIHRVLICGDRDWIDAGMIRRMLAFIGPKNIECVIEGESKGADRIARREAIILGIEVKRFYADWLQYGPSAGPIRNRRMLKEGCPTQVIAFHDDIENSKGTKDMLNAAHAAGIPCTLVTHKGKTVWEGTAQQPTVQR